MSTVILSWVARDVVEMPEFHIQMFPLSLETVLETVRVLYGLLLSSRTLLWNSSIVRLGLDI